MWILVEYAIVEIYLLKHTLFLIEIQIERLHMSLLVN